MKRWRGILWNGHNCRMIATTLSRLRLFVKEYIPNHILYCTKDSTKGENRSMSGGWESILTIYSGLFGEV